MDLSENTWERRENTGEKMVNKRDLWESSLEMLESRRGWWVNKMGMLGCMREM